MTIRETKTFRGEQIQPPTVVTKENFLLPLKRNILLSSQPEWLPGDTALSITVYGCDDLIYEHDHWSNKTHGVSKVRRIIARDKINGKPPHQQGYRVLDGNGILHVFTYEPNPK